MKTNYSFHIQQCFSLGTSDTYPSSYSTQISLLTQGQPSLVSSHGFFIDVFFRAPLLDPTVSPFCLQGNVQKRVSSSGLPEKDLASRLALGWYLGLCVSEMFSLCLIYFCKLWVLWWMSVLHLRIWNFGRDRGWLWDQSSVKKKRKKKTDKNKTRALKSLMHFPGRHFFHTCHNSVLGKLSESWANTEQGLSISPCMPLLFVDLVLCCLVLINIQHKINFESFETFSESLSSLRDPLHREKLEKVIF
jgi:hypothetical protein